MYAYRHALDVLGVRRLAVGICMMTYLRLLVPRRDFFMQAPVVSWMPMLALAIVIGALIPIRLFAITTPILLLAILLPHALALLAPPLWIFFAGSKLDSFQLFYTVRGVWKRHGLNLLNRTSTGGLDFYQAWRSNFHPAIPFYDPSVGRIWSLRTRTPLWQTAVRLLASFVPVIVVDLTSQASSNVQFEMEWLKRRGMLDKVYLVAAQECAYTEWKIKIVDEKGLLASTWAGGKLDL